MPPDRETLHARMRAPRDFFLGGKLENANSFFTQRVPKCKTDKVECRKGKEGNRNKRKRNTNCSMVRRALPTLGHHHCIVTLLFPAKHVDWKNKGEEGKGKDIQERKVLYLVERNGLLVSFWVEDSFLTVLSLPVLSELGLMRTVDSKDTPTCPEVGRAKVTSAHRLLDDKMSDQRERVSRLPRRWSHRRT